MNRYKPLLGQIGRRLFVALLLATLFAALAGGWFYHEAGQRADSDRLARAKKHYSDAIAILDRNWGRMAYQYKARLEYSRLLLNPERREQSLLAYVTVQGASQEFSLIQLRDRQGHAFSISTLGPAGSPEASFPEGSPFGWAWDANKHLLYRVFKQTFWLGEGNGDLLLYLPLDHAFLSQAVYPDTRIGLIWDDRIVAHSEGGDGVAAAQIALSQGTETSTAIRWESASHKSPSLFIQVDKRHPFSVWELVLPLAIGTLAFALAAWAVLGRWSVQLVNRLLAMRLAQENFLANRSVDPATLAQIDQACLVNDEIRSVAKSLGDLMGNVAAHEVSERLIRETLQNSERRFRFLVEGTRAIAWEYDVDRGVYTYVSPRAEEVFGFPLAAWSAPEFLPNLIHPDDSRGVLAQRQGVLDLNIDSTLYYRARTQSGAALWIEDMISPVVNEAGRVYGLRGIMFDVTERKETEERLALAGLVFERADEGIIVTDDKNRIVAVNPAFERITGYRLDEVLGQNPSLLQSGRQDMAFYAELWRSLTTEGQWRGDLWNRRKDGDFYVQHTAIQTILDEHGRAARHVALFRDVTHMRRQAEEIEHQATHDMLTGLPNRRLLRDRIDSALARGQREGKDVALLMLDLDGFKRVNDTLGHRVGDLLLIDAARRLEECIRGSDTLARLGGDEFMIVLESLNRQQDAQTVAHKILEKLQAVFPIEGAEIFVTGSVGIALFPADGSIAETLIANADTAMYQAKSGGKNCYRFFTQTMHEQVSLRLHLENDLRRAIAAQEFQLYYQPIVDLASRRIVKAEALLRWVHPERGVIPPNDFIPIAEESGLINGLGEWVINEAARQMYAWRDIASAGFRININFSAHQFHRGNPADQLRQALANSGALANQLTVEITESLFLDDHFGSASTQLAEMMESGIQIALDDFGTGYSSLSYLKRFPVHTLKIDRGFVSGIPDQPSSVALVDAILSLSRSFGIEVVAEGVETEAQARHLVEGGCLYGQGYLFGKPMPAWELAGLLAAAGAQRDDLFDGPR